MLSKQISTTATLIVLCILAATVVKAQSASTTVGGWAARAAQRNAVEARATSRHDAEVAEATDGQREFNVAASTGSQDVLERYKEGRRRALIGTWRIHIPESDGGLPPFNAFQTFHEGGTFSEVSDLLPTLTESPALGVWDLDGGRFILTFELFAFDPDRKPVGIIRVRCTLDVIGADQLKGNAVVDFIDPDGTEILAIDRSPIIGKKIFPLFLGN